MLKQTLKNFKANLKYACYVEYKNIEVHPVFNISS